MAARRRTPEPAYKTAARASARTLDQRPLLAVLVVVVAGLVLIALGQWRTGLYVVAAGVGLAGVLRLVLPRRLAGLLIVRRRWFDVTVLVGSGVAIALLAWSR